jgi:O-antigen/teichoic acid export membrane protein
VSGPIAKVTAALGSAPRALFVRIAGRALSFLAVVALTRTLGVRAYGIYAYAIAWTTLLTVPTSIGLDNLLIRHISQYRAHRSFSFMRGLIHEADRVTVVFSLVVMAVFGLLSLALASGEYLSVLLVATPLILLQGLAQVDQSVLQGFRFTDLSLVPLFIAAPGALIVVVLVANAIGAAMDALAAVIATIVATAVAAVLARALRILRSPPEVRAAAPEHNSRSWRISLAPLAVVAIMTNISAQIDVILLGWFGDPTQVGRFQIAVRIAQGVSLVLIGINISLAPRIAHDSALGQLESARRAAISASRWALAFSLPLGLAIVVLRVPLFRLFGTDGSGLSLPLVILVCAQVANAAIGSVGVLLLMTGKATAVGEALVAGVALDAVLCVLLIPAYGPDGAAVASAADLLLWNGALTIVVWRIYGFSVSAFARTSTHA